MKQNYDFKIEKIKDLSPEEKSLRKKNLALFYKTGFPNKKDEDWKFSDLNSILNKNFKNIFNNDFLPREREFETIDEFEHNFISLSNGKLISTEDSARYFNLKVPKYELPQWVSLWIQSDSKYPGFK